MPSAADLKFSPSSSGRRIAPVLFFLGPPVTAAVPRLTWLFFSLIAIRLIVPILRQPRALGRLLKPNAVLCAFVLLALYVLLNATWAANHAGAFGKAALLLGVVLIAFAASKAIEELDIRQLRVCALAFAAGAFLGALFVLFELLTKGAITRLAMNSIHWLHPVSAKHVVISNGEVTKIKLPSLNQNVAILMFQLWPGLLVLKTVESGARRFILVGLFFLAAAVPIAISEHDSSQVALIVSLLIFSAAWVWPRVVVPALAIAWCIALVLVLPFDFLAYKTELHLATWLPSSARARVILWEFTAERVLDHPWGGIGADSTPALKEQRDLAERPRGFVYPRMTGEHAHDLFLQTWYELGVVGAILVAFAGVALALRIRLLPSEAQPFAAATFASIASVEAFAWSTWQPWLMCAVGLVLLYLRMAASTVAIRGVPSSTARGRLRLSRS
jgi:O-antigen ligase